MPSVLQVIYYLKQNIFRSSIFRACMIRFVLYLSCITFGWLNKDFAFFSRRESNKYDGRHGKTIIFKKTSGLPQEDFWETNRAQMLDVAVFTLSLPYWDQYLSLSCISSVALQVLSDWAQVFTLTNALSGLTAFQKAQCDPATTITMWSSIQGVSKQTHLDARWFHTRHSFPLKIVTVVQHSA